MKKGVWRFLEGKRLRLIGLGESLGIQEKMLYKSMVEVR